MNQKLTPQALEELKQVLLNDYGHEELKRFTDEMLHELGLTLLRMAASCIKADIDNAYTKESPSVGDRETSAPTDAQWHQICGILEGQEGRQITGRPRVDPPTASTNLVFGAIVVTLLLIWRSREKEY